jgi:hypothetical protein
MRPKKSLDDMTEPELQKVLQEVAERVKWSLPEGTGFIVLATPFGKEGVAQYVSNVERETAVPWMLETMLRWMRKDFVPRVGR